MDFARSDEQDEIAGLARRILTDKVTEDVLRQVGTGGPRFDRDTWYALAEADLLGVAVPSEFGGLGLGMLEQCAVLDEVGRAVAPVPVLASIVGGVLPLAEFGDAAMAELWVGPAVEGLVLVTAALAEPLNRWPERPSTTAVRRDKNWCLDGVKTCVPLATIADALLVPATLEDGSVAVFLIDTGADGLSVEPQEVIDHDVLGQVTLHGVGVGDGAVLGSVELGAEVLAWMVQRYTIGLAAQSAGVVGRALELTAAYTKERVQFDRPIATFQAVSQRAADAYLDVEAVRLVVLQAAWRMAEGLPADLEVEVAKFWAAEAAHRVGHAAVHLHGGAGIDEDQPIHRYFLAAKQLEFTLGCATDQLLRIGAALAASRE